MWQRGLRADWCSLWDSTKQAADRLSHRSNTSVNAVEVGVGGFCLPSRGTGDISGFISKPKKQKQNIYLIHLVTQQLICCFDSTCPYSFICSFTSLWISHGTCLKDRDGNFPLVLSTLFRRKSSEENVSHVKSCLTELIMCFFSGCIFTAHANCDCMECVAVNAQETWG